MRSSAARRQLQLSLDELLHLRWLIGGALALLSVWTLFYLEASMWLVALAASGVIGVALVYPQLPGRVPRVCWRLGLPLIMIVFGLDLLLHDIIPAFVRLNVMLVAFRAVAFRTPREDLQLLVLSLFLIVVTGVLTVSLGFAAQILVFTGLAMAFLFVLNLIEDASGGAPVVSTDWTRISRRRFLLRLWQAADLRLLGLGVSLFAAVLAISTVLFLSIPRFQMENPLSFLSLNKTRSTTGFSETISLGEVTDIAQNSAIAMRVDVIGGDAVPPAPYWRMIVLDQYERGRFSISSSVTAAVGARSYPTLDLRPEPDALPFRRAAGARYTVYLEGGVTRYLPLPGAFEAVRFTEMQDIVSNKFFNIFRTEKESAALLSYQIEGADLSGIMPDPDFAATRLTSRGAIHAGGRLRPDSDIRQANMPYPETTRFLALPESSLEYLRAVVRTISGGDASLSAEEFARRACALLADEHRYSLGVTLPASPDGEDPVIRWMKGQLPGHCEFFAAAFTLLSRAAGHPTRAIAGFKGGTWNAYENYYMVRNSDAHAWCEIYNGAGAWLRVDPTPGGGGVAEGGESIAVTLLRADNSFSAYFDSLRMIWYRRIVNFDQRSQRRVGQAVAGVGDSVLLWSRATIDTVWGDFSSWMRSPWTFQNKGDLLFVAVFCFLLSRVMKRFGIGTTDVLTWFRKGEHSTRARAGDLLRRLERRMEHPPRRDWKPDTARAVAAQLIVIRYARPESWEEPLRVFRAARRLL